MNWLCFLIGHTQYFPLDKDLFRWDDTKQTWVAWCRRCKEEHQVV